MQYLKYIGPQNQTYKSNTTVSIRPNRNHKYLTRYFILSLDHNEIIGVMFPKTFGVSHRIVFV